MCYIVHLLTACKRTGTWLIQPMLISDNALLLWSQSVTTLRCFNEVRSHIRMRHPLVLYCASACKCTAIWLIQPMLICGNAVLCCMITHGNAAQLLIQPMSISDNIVMLYNTILLYISCCIMLYNKAHQSNVVQLLALAPC